MGHEGEALFNAFIEAPERFLSLFCHVRIQEKSVTTTHRGLSLGAQDNLPEYGWLVLGKNFKVGTPKYRGLDLRG